jgi:NADPH2:quinone reductase
MYVATGQDQSRVAIQEAPSPIASPGAAVVEVHAISLNRGELSGLAAEGSRPGWDISGVVVQGDPDGRGPQAGARVAAVVREGGWAEHVSVPVGQLGALPDSVSMEQGSTLGIAGLTALRLLRAAGPVAGKRVLVTGASGAVGRFVVQLATLYSAGVTALVSKPDQIEPVRAIGADRVIVDGDELAELYDIVIDGVGGPALEAGVRAAGPNAQIFTYGIASGTPANIRFADFRNGPGSSLRGFFIWQSDLATFGSDLSYLATLVAAGALDAHVAKRFEWSQANDALDALVERTVAGKVVVRVN